MKLRNALTSLTLVGSFIALAPQGHAVVPPPPDCLVGECEPPPPAPDQGIDFPTGDGSLIVTSRSDLTPDVLRMVTATCPQAGFLYAMAGTSFLFFNSVLPPSGETKVGVRYSLSKDLTSLDPNFHDFEFVLENKADVSSVPVMRVDSCTAGQSVTYRFNARKLGTAGDFEATAFHPSLVVTFFKNRI